MSTTRLDPAGMTRVIRGARYSVNASTLLADNDYWDGNNFTKSGRNTFLYKTRGGAYFAAHMTCWQGESDTLEPLSREEAMELWEQLPEHAVSYEDAFDAVVEEASAGRPTYYGETMKQTAVWLPQTMIDWLKAQPEGMGNKMRELIAAAQKSNA
jgi:hypothetical protein